MERQTAKLVRQKQKLGVLEQGGSADRPIEVASASVIEAHARSTACILCDGSLLIDEHSAAADLRIVATRCMSCGNRRDLYYRIARAS